MARRGMIGEVRFHVVYTSSSSDVGKTRDGHTRDLKSERGWISAPLCSLPQELILLLGERSNVVKVQLKSHPDYCPQKVDVHIASSDEDSEMLKGNQNLCRLANFVRAGMIEFQADSRSVGDKKTIYMDKSGNIVKITVHGSFSNSRNSQKQIGIASVVVSGYPEHVRSKNKIDSVAPSLMHQLSGSASNSFEKKRLDNPSFAPPMEQSRQREESWREGRDPVLQLQTLQRILERKKEEAIVSDKMVLARMCAAAIERLQKAEGEIEHYARQKRAAIVQGGEYSELAEFERKMVEVKDQVIRAVHLELILDQKERDSIDAQGRPPPPEPAIKSPPQFHYPPPPPYFHHPHHCHHEHTDDSSEDSEDSGREEEIKANNKERAPPVPFCDDVCCNAEAVPKKVGKEAASRAESSSVSNPASSTQEGTAQETQPLVAGSKENLPPNTCPFCLETNVAFAKQNRLNGHYTERCPVMIKCPYCGRVVEVKNFDNHKMNNCKMIYEQTSQCTTCGLACTDEQITEHNNGIGCAGRKPKPNMKFCSLCNTEVEMRDSAWRDHLMTDIASSCTGNNRKGLSGYPGSEKKSKKSTGKKKKSKKSDKKAKKERRRKSSKPAEAEASDKTEENN